MVLIEPVVKAQVTEDFLAVNKGTKVWGVDQLDAGVVMLEPVVS